MARVVLSIVFALIAFAYYKTPSREGPALAPIPASAPASAAPASAPEQVVMVPDTLYFNSGDKASGVGGAWSGWHELCSAPLPTGATITSAALHLSGDRSCGAWSECREQSRTATRVCWQFRMQGHNENNSQANSEGHLEVQIQRPR